MIDLSDSLMNQNTKKVHDVGYCADEFTYQGGTYPVKVAPFALEITSPKKNSIHVKGNTCVTLTIPCDRCLQDVVCEFPIDVTRDYVIGEEPQDDEIEVLPEAALDEQDLIFSEILLNLPAKVLCKEECKGFCRVCGKNLNNGECGCDREVLDPRMAAVLDVFHNFGKTNN